MATAVTSVMLQTGALEQSEIPNPTFITQTDYTNKKLAAAAWEALANTRLCNNRSAVAHQHSIPDHSSTCRAPLTATKTSANPSRGDAYNPIQTYQKPLQRSSPLHWFLIKTLKPRIPLRRFSSTTTLFSSNEATSLPVFVPETTIRVQKETEPP